MDLWLEFLKKINLEKVSTQVRTDGVGFRITSLVTGLMAFSGLTPQTFLYYREGQVIETKYSEEKTKEICEKYAELFEKGVKKDGKAN